MRKLSLFVMLAVLAFALSTTSADAATCAPTCSCQASYNGGICHADWGPCPSGMCATCSCTSETGCVGGCVPKASGGGGGGGSECPKGLWCPMFIEADALTVTGFVEFIRPHVPPGWTVAFVGEDDGARATFSGEWTLDDLLRIHYGRRLIVDEGRKTARIAR